MADDGMYAGAADGPARAREAYVAASPGAGWEARLKLHFDGEAPTVLRRAEHFGPLRVQRPFYPSRDPACHVYVLHPPGGIVGGDDLAITVSAEGGARVLLTAPGATKLYRSTGAQAHISTAFTLADRACVEWFPHEVIAFDGAVAQLSTRVALGAEARFAGWEIVCLGRPTAGERFLYGRLRTSLRIEREGRVCFQERGHFEGGDALLREGFGLAGYAVFGSLVVAAPEVTTAWAEDVREVLRIEGGLTSATVVSGVLVVRGFAHSTRILRAVFERAFAHLRPRYAGCEAVLPRIWNT